MEMKENIKKHKGALISVVGILVGVILMLSDGLLPNSEKHKETEKEGYYDVRFYTESLEQRIGALCTSIAGITEANILLTLDCSTEYVYAQNITESKGGENLNFTTDYVIVSNNEENNTVQLLEIYPKIRGIAVVCTGGDDIETKQKIIDLLSAALGIPSNRIKVAGT